MNYRNTKDTVLITGASRGIGKAIAKAFASEGYPLYLCCQSHYDQLTSFSDELSKAYNIYCKAFHCNVGDEESVKQLFSDIEKGSQGAPSIVVNNAGIAHYGLITEMTSDKWHEILSVNLDSVFYTSRAVIPSMLQKRRGRIINISSIWGNVGASCEVAYSASKGAVNSFTKALAKELAPSGIPVNAIACGMVNTEMNTSHLSSEEIAEITTEIPADRISEPEEIAALVLQLATSPTYLTGQVITIDGGWS